MERDGHWPKREVLRLEGFSDAVFAFALTLLVVSLEVPKSFDELLITLSAAPAFAVSFALFWIIWREHHRFFRRYGLDDGRIVMLNACLLFVVLLYVYPLKFLFAMLLGRQRGTEMTIRAEQVKTLMAIYSTGYGAVFALFALMYRHAYTRRAHLRLDARQIFETRAREGAMVLHAAFGLISVSMAVALPYTLAFLAGLFYFLVGPAQWLYWMRTARRRARLTLS